MTFSKSEALEAAIRWESSGEGLWGVGWGGWGDFQLEKGGGVVDFLVFEWLFLVIFSDFKGV